MATDEVPADVRPLVDAINQPHGAHARGDGGAPALRRRCIAPVAHAAGDARDPGRLRAAHRRPGSSCGRCCRPCIASWPRPMRQANQMLALARADSAGLVAQSVDLARWPASSCGPGGRRRVPATSTWVSTCQGIPSWRTRIRSLLREALANLLHNAIRYTPAGGEVTVRVGAGDAHARVQVIDDGPRHPRGRTAPRGRTFLPRQQRQRTGRPGSAWRSFPRWRAATAAGWCLGRVRAAPGSPRCWSCRASCPALRWLARRPRVNPGKSGPCSESRLKVAPR